MNNANTPAAFYCEHDHQCKWKPGTYPTWGNPKNAMPEWLAWHKKECGGKLIGLYRQPLDALLLKEELRVTGDLLDGAMSELQKTKGHNAARTKWVNCPVCHQPDMRCDVVDEGATQIHCTNLACPSNIPLK